MGTYTPSHPKLSIVIPVGCGDTAVPALLSDLKMAPPNWEIIVTFTGEHPLVGQVDDPKVRWLRVVNADRASQLNAGAAAARAMRLWFLHADSRIDQQLLAGLQQRLKQGPLGGRLLYFDLVFYDGTHRLQALNAVGANLRARFLGMPFGDQGFVVCKRDWQRLGGFPEDAAYGEDHLFVWHCRQAGLVLERQRQRIATSARKYNQGGWSAVTRRHFVLTWKQAIPELSKLLQSRLRRKF